MVAQDNLVRLARHSCHTDLTVHFPMCPQIAFPRGCKVTLVARRELLKAVWKIFNPLVQPAGEDCQQWLVGSNCSLRAAFTDPQSKGATCVVTYFPQ